jgi:predicted phage-related endonuclease
MAVTGAPRAILSALVLDGDTAVQHFEIERDDEFIDGTLIPGLREFWSRVEAGRDAPDPFQYAPPPDGSASAARVLSKLYPDPDPEESVELPDELQGMALEFVALGEVAHKANATARKAADERRRIVSELTTYLGPAQIGSFSDGSYIRRSKVGRSGHTIRFYEARDDG